VGDDGLSTVIYRSQRVQYRYGPRLLVFNARDQRVQSLPDATAARAWWSVRQPPDCPGGAAGYGTTLFQWDIRYRDFENKHLWR
jgi:hypothetical protein